MMQLVSREATAHGQTDCIQVSITPGIRLLTLIRLLTSVSIFGCQQALML